MTGEEADASGEALLELGDEARLADPRLAGDRDDRAPSFEQPVEHLAQRRELLLAADERRLRACAKARADAHDAEGADGLALSLQLEIAERVELEQPVDLVRRRRPHDEIAQRLQARGDVDGVAERVVEDVRRRVAGREPRPGPC